MSIEDPTLKIRVKLPDGIYLTRDCGDVARDVVGGMGEVLDAKWGRPPSMWHSTGRGWGRQKLSESERGYVTAVRDALDDGNPVVAELVRIIDRLTKGGTA